VKLLNFGNVFNTYRAPNTGIPTHAHVYICQYTYIFVSMFIVFGLLSNYLTN